MMMVAVLVAFPHDRGTSQRESVLLGEEDGAAVDVVERDQPREQGSQGRVRFARRQVGPRAGPPGRRRRRPGARSRGLDGHASLLALLADLVALEGGRDRLRPTGAGG